LDEGGLEVQTYSFNFHHLSSFMRLPINTNSSTINITDFYTDTPRWLGFGFYQEPVGLQVLLRITCIPSIA